MELVVAIAVVAIICGLLGIIFRNYDNSSFGDDMYN